MPWVTPNWNKEFEEFEKLARCGDIDNAVKAFNIARRSGESVRLSLEDPLWMSMKHTTSGQPLTRSRAIVEATANGHRIEPIFDAIDKNKNLPMPIVMVCEDGTYYKVAGNHRLMACRALGIQPLVWMFQYPPIREGEDENVGKNDALRTLVQEAIKRVIHESTEASALVLSDKGAMLLIVPRPQYDKSYFAGKQDIIELPNDKSHVTLIGIKTLKSQREMINKAWTEIVQNLPKAPVPEFDSLPRVARRDNGKETWFLQVTNQNELQSYVENIENAIRDRVPEYEGNEDRFFHLSIANNRGGNSFESIGDINQDDVEESDRASQKAPQAK